MISSTTDDTDTFMSSVQSYPSFSIVPINDETRSSSDLRLCGFDNQNEIKEDDSRIFLNFPKFSAKIALTVSVLDQIASSIKVFKPSLSFSSLCSIGSKLNLATCDFQSTRSKLSLTNLSAISPDKDFDVVIIVG
jgi:hypothetical protein